MSSKDAGGNANSEDPDQTAALFAHSYLSEKVELIKGEDSEILSSI